MFYLRKGLEIIVANYPAGSVRQGFNYENIALAFKSNKQLDSALHYMQLAHTILPQQLPPNDYSMAVHFFSYANILYQLDRLKEADAMLQKSNAVYEDLGLHQSAEYGQNLALQGLIAAEGKDWTLADQKFELALKKVQSAAVTNPSATAFQLSPNSLWLINEYTAYLFLKYQSTAQVEALQLFETYADIYLNLSDKFRKQFTDPYTKSVLIKDNAEVYNRNIGIYNLLYRQTKKEAYLQAAYQFSEYGRSCLLRDLQDEKIKSYAGLPDAVLQKEIALKQKVSQLNEQLLEQADNEQLKQDLFASEEALNAFIDETAQAYPRYYELKFKANVPSLASLQSKVEPGHNLVEYMQDDTAYYALVIHSTNSDLIYLGNVHTLDQAIVNWKAAMVKQDQAALDRAGQVLYTHLWHPLVDQLSGNRITIIPTGRLFYLNFESLRRDTSPRSYLIYDYNITYALSFAVLFRKIKKRKRAPSLPSPQVLKMSSSSNTKANWIRWNP
ncbi:MAG: CHAT domain-containing protein [Saprospiraceae bacterium]